MSAIQKGALVRVRAADNETLTKRALSSRVQGLDFPIVWVCSEAEWRRAMEEGREPQGVPWPADAVSLAS